MTFKSIISTLLVAACAMTCGAENKATNHSRAVKAHREAHQRLANVNTKMDMSSIEKMIREDVAKSEAVKKNVSENASMLSDVLKEARKHIGKPYRHGMKGPKAFDCSGFSSYVYRQFGISLSPSSRAQATQGTKVSRNELREGDLVFFTSPRSGRNVGHVGIVVSADNETGDFKFIHASTRYGVKIDECKGYYAKRLLNARRVVD